MNLIILNFILSNIAILIGAFFNCALLEGSYKSSLSKIILATITIYFSFIVVIQISLGTVGLLSYFNLTIFSYLIFAICYLLSRRKLALYFSHLKSELINFKREKNFSPIFLILLPIIGILFIKFSNSLLQIPLDYDAMVYHLPIVTEWLNSGSITDVYYTAFSGPLGYYPSNFNLFYSWIAVFLKNDFLLNLLNFPLLALLSFTIYQIANNFKFEPKVSLLISFFPFFMPVFLQQAGSILVDTFFTLTAAFSIYFLQELNANPSNKSNAILFGLSLGLFLGTKYLGLPFSIVFIIILFFNYFKNKYKNPRIFYACAISLILTGSFFYLRNFLSTGNPIYPANVSLFGAKIFSGYSEMSLQISNTDLLSHLGEFQTWKDFLRSFYTMTDLPGLIILLSFIATAIFLFLSKAKKSTAALIFFAGLGLFLLYLKAPFSHRDLIHNIRYAMPFLVFGILNLGFLLNLKPKLYPLASLICGLAFLHSIIYLLLYPAYKITLDLHLFKQFMGFNSLIFLTAISILIVLIFRNRKKVFYGFLFIALVSVSIFLNIAGTQRADLATYSYDKRYPVDNKYSDIIKSAMWFNQNAPQANIAYSGFNFHYPLIGKNFTRKVDYININNCMNCRYADYQDSIRENPDYQSWLQNLRQKSKEYLVINTQITPYVKIYELSWAESHHEHFELIRQYRDTYIFKINF